MYKHVIQNINR